MTGTLSALIVGGAARLVTWLGVQALWGLALAVPVAVVDRLLGRRLPALRWTLWNLVLLRFVVPAGLTVPWGLVGSWRLGGLAGPAAESPIAWPRLVPTIAGAAPGAGAEPSAWLWLGLGAAWLAGAAFVAVRWHQRRSRFRRLADGARPVTCGGPAVRLDEWRRALGVRRSLRLVLADAGAPVEQPFTLGLLRPVLCLPRELAEHDNGELDAVLGHETAHVRHLDDLALVVEAFLGAVFWFHPVVWFARLRLDDLRERLCDAATITTGAISKRSYARALLALACGSAGQAAAVVPRPAAGAFWSRGRSRRALAERLVGVMATGRRPRRLAWLAAGLLAMLAALPATPSSPGGAPHEAPAQLRATSLHWVAPVVGARVTSPFGARRDPFTGRPAHHDGVDLGAAVGSPVRAVADGVVRVASRVDPEAPERGTVVVIEHAAGYSSLYAHLGDLVVKPGERVEAGQVIGHLGGTGAVTGPHVHLEIRRRGDPVDPMPLLGG